MEPLVAALSRGLAKAGIDITHPLCLNWYNDSIPAELGARIPARGAAGPNALAVLVANSRALWEAFLPALAASPDLLAADHPLERYLEAAVGAALAAAAPGRPAARIYWSHRRAADLVPPPAGGPASEHVALQRMAHHSGLAFLDHGSHLCLHPRFGPWFSLRCAIVFDDTPYAAPKPAELPHPLPIATQRYVQMALASAVHNTSRKFDLPEVEVEAAEAALAEASMEPGLDSDDEGEEEEVEEGGRLPARPAANAGSTARPQAAPSSDSTSSAGSDQRASAHPHAAAQPGRGAAAPAEAGAPTAARHEGASVHASASAAGPAGALSSSRSGSPAEAGSPGGSGTRRAGSPRGGRPSMRAVTANWQAWVAVRDSPFPGHPMRYTDEQIRYHYTRDPSVLARALLRRNLAPATPLPTTGLLRPALLSAVPPQPGPVGITAP